MHINQDNYQAIEKQLHRIKDIIREHDYNNYILDAPTISENDYNKLVEEMKMLERKIDDLANSN